jgi:hypothetical protein
MADRQRLFGEAQLRAHLSVLIGGAKFQERARGLRFEVSPKMLNTGHTAASNVKWKIGIAVVDKKDEATFRFPLRREKQKGSAILGAHQDAFMPVVLSGYVPDQDVSVIKEGVVKGLYVWGYVVYEDIFSRVHRTVFAQQIYWDRSSEPDQNWVYPEFIMGWYLSKHNCSN